LDIETAGGAEGQQASENFPHALSLIVSPPSFYGIFLPLFLSSVLSHLLKNCIKKMSYDYKLTNIGLP
jgi:hypothetical protein